MSSRNLLNLVLLIVIIALIAIVIYEPGISPEPVNPRLTSLKQEDIIHIYIKRDTDEDVELEKINGTWQMRKPYPVLAHDFRVETILRLSEAESHSQHDLAKLDKKKFGLDKPKAIVTFNKHQQILFGDNEPLRQQRYVQTDSTLHTITDNFYYQVASRVSTFIDHGLLAKDSAITKLELPDYNVELIEGKWQVSPQPENFTADTITDLVNQWRNIQAIEIDKAGKTPAGQVITIHMKDKPAISFSIVKNEAGIALVRSDIGLAYNISEDNFKKLTSLSLTNSPEDRPE